LSRYRRELSVAVAIFVIFGIMAVTAPRFFAPENALDVLLANIPVLIVATGMTMTILVGQIDISVGSQFAVCSVLAGVLASLGLPVVLAAVFTCVIGGLLGALNGALVSFAGIPSIVVTLAVMVALRDALRWATQGAWIQNLPEGFQWFGLSQSGSAALTACIAFGLLFASSWLLRNTAAGRTIYATGSDAGAARLAGINPQRVTLWVFAILGALTGCAAVLNAVRFDQIPSNAGIGLELKAIAAVVVGGTAITGGRGTVLGTALGVILLGTIGPALTFMGVNAYWERAIEGGIILAAVAIDSVRIRSGKHAGNLAAARA
jgi:rhamnose transport system permease protein